MNETEYAEFAQSIEERAAAEHAARLRRLAAMFARVKARARLTMGQYTTVTRRLRTPKRQRVNAVALSIVNAARTGAN